MDLEPDTYIEKLKKYHKSNQSRFRASYFPFYSELIVLMNGDEALLFSYLLDLAGLYLIDKANDKDYRRNVRGLMFKCPVDTVEKKLKYTPATQKRIFKNLEKLGLLKRKLMGEPAKRYVYLDLVLLEEKLYQACMERVLE